MGADAIMDLSSHGNTEPFRKKLTSECPVMIGTVPIYDSVIHYQRDLDIFTAKDFIDVVRLHAENGVDFVTLHCGITRKTIDQIKKHKRNHINDFLLLYDEKKRLSIERPMIDWKTASSFSIRKCARRF